MDNDTVVAAMPSPMGASAAILRAARQGRATLLLNVPLALEYEAVCRGRRGALDREVAIFLDAIIAMAEPVPSHFLWRPQLRDPNHEMVLEAAVNGRADALVTSMCGTTEWQRRNLEWKFYPARNNSEDQTMQT